MTYKLNPKASTFYDPTLGLKLLPGYVVEIDAAMTARSKRLRAAINSGHIVMAEAVAEKAPMTIAEKVELFKNLANSGKSAKDIAKKFSMETLKDLCEGAGIEPEDGDTKETLVEALIADLAAAESGDNE